MSRLALLAVLFLLPATALADASGLRLDGAFRQGGLVVGQAPPGTRIELNGRPVAVARDGSFLLGFGRDAGPTAEVAAVFPDGGAETRSLKITGRDYDVQRIDGLPQRKVTPKEEDLKRIRREKAEMAAAREKTDLSSFLATTGFVWPAEGRISGVYGSRRILNGTPKRPHYGVDVAAPVGTPLRAAAAGVVRLAHEGMFFNGKTVVIDHGLGLHSVYIHMNDIRVRPGSRVEKGETIGTIGRTGRATGPHVHWEVSLGGVGLDPALLAGPMAEGD